MTDQNELDEFDPSNLTDDERRAEDEYLEQQAEAERFYWRKELDELGVLTELTELQQGEVADHIYSARLELWHTLDDVAYRDKMMSKYPSWNDSIRRVNTAAGTARKALQQLARAIEGLRKTHVAFSRTAKDCDSACRDAVRAIRPLELPTMNLIRTLPGKAKRRGLVEEQRLSLQALFCRFGKSHRDARVRTALVANAYFDCDIKFNREIPPDVPRWKRKDERRKAAVRGVSKVRKGKDRRGRA